MNYLYATINLSQNLIDYQNIQSLFSVSLLSSLTIPASTTLRRESLIIVNKDNRNKNLGPYLAGLIEGDGSIIVPNKPFSPSGSVNRGGFEICFHIKDLALAEYLKRVLPSPPLPYGTPPFMGRCRTAGRGGLINPYGRGF